MAVSKGGAYWKGHGLGRADGGSLRHQKCSPFKVGTKQDDAWNDGYIDGYQSIREEMRQEEKMGEGEMKGEGKMDGAFVTLKDLGDAAFELRAFDTDERWGFSFAKSTPKKLAMLRDWAETGEIVHLLLDRADTMQFRVTNCKRVMPNGR